MQFTFFFCGKPLSAPSPYGVAGTVGEMVGVVVGAWVETLAASVAESLSIARSARSTMFSCADFSKTLSGTSGSERRDSSSSEISPRFQAY